MKKYKTVVCGGTFDHFHKGHEDFLDFALQTAEGVLIGITSDTYILRYKFHTTIETYEKRKLQIDQFLKKRNATTRVRIASIDSVYIPSVWESSLIDAIIVSSESVSGAEVINKERKKRGKGVLDIIMCPLTVAEDGDLISSSRIRSGEINRKGQLYIRNEWKVKTLLLPAELRRQLQNPIGVLITDVHSWLNREHFGPTDITSVGDVVTETLNSRKILQQISIIDFFVERKKVYSNLSELGFQGGEKVRYVKNPPGGITPAFFKAIKMAFLPESYSNRQIIKVDGEEDLGVLPVILSAPLGHIVIYGQPQRGIVKVTVTEEEKDQSVAILDQFT